MIISFNIFICFTFYTLPSFTLRVLKTLRFKLPGSKTTLRSSSFIQIKPTQPPTHQNHEINSQYMCPCGDLYSWILGTFHYFYVFHYITTNTLHIVIITKTFISLFFSPYQRPKTAPNTILVFILLSSCTNWLKIKWPTSFLVHFYPKLIISKVFYLEDFKSYLEDFQGV